MRALKFITGHVIYNPAYTYLQIPTENHQYASNKTNLPGLVTKSCKSGLDNLKGKPKTVTEGFGKT